MAETTITRFTNIPRNQWSLYRVPIGKKRKTKSKNIKEKNPASMNDIYIAVYHSTMMPAISGGRRRIKGAVFHKGTW